MPEIETSRTDGRNPIRRPVTNIRQTPTIVPARYAHDIPASPPPAINTPMANTAVAIRWITRLMATACCRSITPAAARIPWFAESARTATVNTSETRSFSLLPEGNTHTTSMATGTNNARMARTLLSNPSSRSRAPLASWISAVSKPHTTKAEIGSARLKDQLNCPKSSMPNIRAATANMTKEATFPTISATAKTETVRAWCTRLRCPASDSDSSSDCPALGSATTHLTLQ